jgi:hypothetical protein
VPEKLLELLTIAALLQFVEQTSKLLLAHLSPLAAQDYPHTTRPWLTNKSVLDFRTVSFVTVLNFPTVGGGYFILWSVY